MANRDKIRSRLAGILWRSLPPAAILLPPAAFLTAARQAQGQIYNYETNQVIPGTQGVTLGPGVDLSSWNTPGHELDYANLSGFNLANASFASSDLAPAAINGSTLTSANFTSANLTNAGIISSVATGANFTNANLTNVRFSLSTLTSVNFTDANLTGAQFSQSPTLTGATFTGAVVNSVLFSSAIGFTASQLYSTASYASGSLTGVNLQSSDLTGWSLANQNLTNANLSSTTLTNTNLGGAIVQGVNFANATGLTAGQLYSTASYTSGNLSALSLAGDNLTGWTFTNQNLAGADFSNATLTDSDFSGAIIQGAEFSTSGNGFTANQLYSTASYASGNLAGIAFGNSNLTGWSFANQNLTNANFAGSILTNVNFTGAIVQAASFSTVTGLTASQFYSTASYINGNLTGIIFENLDLAGWNLANQNFTNANLSATNLTNAGFVGAVVSMAKLNGVTGLTAAQLYSTASYTSGNLTGIGLDDDNLAGWNFANQNLTTANLAFSTLTNANFTGATVTGVSFANTIGLTVGQLSSTASYTSSNLTDIDFQQDNLAGANFANQNLTKDFFEYVTLTGANFANANLTDCNLSGATLTNANFTGATVEGASLAIVTSDGFTVGQLYSTASYAVEDLMGVNFMHDDLTAWNLAGQNLTNANFNFSTLTNTNFSDADLRGAIAWSPVASTLTQNTIQPYGSIAGLALHAGETLIIRNDTIPVTVQTTATFDPASTLQFQLDQNWTSPVGFAAGVTPAFNGTLDLVFASDVAPGNLLGTTFQLFNYNAPLAAGNRFASTTTAPGYAFNLSNLYTTGAATLVGVPAVTVGTTTTPATMQLPSGVGLMTTSSLTINPGSTLDITNDALSINYTPGSSPACAIRQWLTTGYANDTWTGPGIDSSAAAINPGRYAIGYADGNVDQGTAAGPNQVLVEYTLAGDANLDGTVNFADLLVVAQNFNHTLDTLGNPIDWADGDFNYDGVVNFADLLLVAQNFNQTLSAGQLEQLPGSFSAAWNLALAEVQQANTNNVPEPASLSLLAIGGTSLLLRRRRNVSQCR